MRTSRFPALVGLVLLASPLVAAPPSLTVPDKVYGEEGQWTWFNVQTSAKWVEILPADGKSLSFFPSEKLKDPTEIGVMGASGTYELWVLVGNDEGRTKKKITVTVGKAPRPPTPGPDPEPKPPDPGPKPAPDPKSDPALIAKFKLALDKDIATFGKDQPDHAFALGKVYLDAAAALRADASNTLTVGQLYSITFNASVAAGVPRRDKALAEVRNVVDADAKLDPTAVLAGAVKEKYAALWERWGASLREASK